MTIEAPNVRGSSLRIVIDTRPSADLEDQEVVAYMVRLIRSGALQHLKAFMGHARSMFPDMAQERINKCAVETARHFGAESG